MKKITAILLLSVVSTIAFADDKYTSFFSSRSDATFQSQYFAHKNSLFDSFLVNKDSSITFGFEEVAKSKVDLLGVTLGVYTFDSNGNVLQTYTVSGAEIAAGNTALNFTAGERVAFWLDTGSGNVSDSMINSTHSGFYGISVSNTAVGLVFGDPSVGAGVYGRTIIQLNGDAFSPTAKNATAPSGQPLPGIFATILIASSGLALYARKRKSKKA